jgi:hypothetical protein
MSQAQPLQEQNENIDTQSYDEGYEDIDMEDAMQPDHAAQCSMPDSPYNARTRRLSALPGIAGRVKATIEYMKTQNLTLPLLLSSLFYEHEELDQDPRVVWERTCLTSYSDLVSILKRMHHRPKRHNAGQK